MRTAKPLRSFPLLLAVGALAVGCAASTEGVGAEGDAIIGPIPIPYPFPKRLPNPPSTPALYSVVPYPTTVAVSWVSPDATMDSFTVYRRDASWTWQPVHTEANTPGKKYTWVDADRSLSAQCYMVSAFSNATGLGASTKEQCTVRPDPSVFPQSAPTAAVQWFGLSNRNDGVDILESGELFVQYEDQTWGVDLGLGHDTGDNVKAERRGGGASWPLMKGEAIAIRVWGAGWLKYGNETWGVDLQLSDTPSYEWYVVGDGTPGQTLDDGEFALYNKSANDFLVRGDQTWGVSLNWYKKTLPSTGGGGGGTTPRGPSEYVLYDCIEEARPLEMWVEDVTAGTGFQDKGTLDAEWMDGSCPDTGSPFTFVPVSGHSYVIRAMDFTAPGCSNSPDVSSCTRMQSTFVGDSTGQPMVLTAG